MEPGELRHYIRKIDRDNNIGLVRYILAFGVLISHFNILCGAHVPWLVTNYDRVGGFFTLSGFLLLTPILKGIKFKKFAIKRAWRLLPSYLFVVIVFACALSCLSELSFSEYFASKGFWEYLAANISFLNFLHPDLPGVFTDLEINAVNGALWTMKVEWVLTLSIPIVIWLVKKYHLKLRRTVTVIIVMSLVYRLVFMILYDNTENEIYEILGRQFGGQSLYFYGGILIYTFYEEIKQRKIWFILSSLIFYIIFRCIDFIPLYYVVLHPFVISLLVISFSIIPGKFIEYIDRGNNISYEIYLCHFPVMQVMAHFKMIECFGVAASLTAGIVTTILLAIIVYSSVGRLYKSHK